MDMMKSRCMLLGEGLRLVWKDDNESKTSPGVRNAVSVFFDKEFKTIRESFENVADLSPMKMIYDIGPEARHLLVHPKSHEIWNTPGIVPEFTKDFKGWDDKCRVQC
jgi:hypothetical protein